MNVIGILGSQYLDPSKRPFWWNEVSYTRQGFIDVLQSQGHQTVVLPIDKPETAEAYVLLVDRLLLTGGEDITPRFYNEEPHPLLEGTNPSRDAFEIAAVKAAVKFDKPILGVCRGMQLINVALGGTLYQDLSLSPAKLKHRQAPTSQVFPTHEISVKFDSFLRFLPEHYYVNSFHHQAIKDLAPDLTATAHTSDGIIEGIENREKRIFGVQWHPEATWHKEPNDREIFRFFAEEL